MPQEASRPVGPVDPIAAARRQVTFPWSERGVHEREGGRTNDERHRSFLVDANQKAFAR
ncbi:hypothetical protein GCM10010308_71210 [Streptomyces vinaceusdrappus]|nr:hypothetical protein GCM10010308_71210 [Streptomyces vinaceusdrappus]